MEMTCVSVTFGERIKDGLCCRCHTEGARRTAGAEGADTSRAQETGTTVGLQDEQETKAAITFFFSGLRHKVDDKRGKEPPLSVREDGATRGDTQM